MSGELDNTALPGMQHKFAQTAMIRSTHECAMYCRHCFRKRLLDADASEVAGQFDAMLAYILRHPEISNVLISGGDALLCDNVRLDALLGMLFDTRTCKRSASQRTRRWCFPSGLRGCRPAFAAHAQACAKAASSGNVV